MKSTLSVKIPIFGSVSRISPLFHVQANATSLTAKFLLHLCEIQSMALSISTPPQFIRARRFSDIRLRLKEGKIVDATSNNTERLNDILDTDEGARYIGEFSIAFNPYITDPMLDILFDEKMAGSFHFTPGQA